MSDVNINKLTKFYIKNKKIATLTAVRYKNPKGVLLIDKNSKVKTIKEKPIEYINGGFVLSKKIFKYLTDDKNILKKIVYQNMSKIKQLQAFKHNGF